MKSESETKILRADIFDREIKELVEKGLLGAVALSKKPKETIKPNQK